MKIYQVHMRGGEWEDAYDHIINSYLSYDKAKVEYEKLQATLKCSECIIANNWCFPGCEIDECGSNECHQACISYVKEKCKEADVYVGERNQLQCKNMIKSRYYDVIEYYIQEVDVIE